MKRNKYKSQKKTARIDVLVVVLSLSTSLFAEKGFRLLTTISGEKAGDQFCTVKNIGDVNGDGFNDLLVGAAEASYTKLYYGGSDFDTVADLVMRVPKHYDYFGQTLATGDLNNDGFSDFAIGAPYYDEYDRCGKIFVYFGGTGIDSTADMEIEGYGYWHLMGSSIVCNCDVNGDGYQDLLTCSGQYPRKTYIYFGGANMDNVPDIYLAGKDSIICNVGGPSGIGDINNDGYDDFFVTITSEVGMPNLLPGTGNYLIYGGENISLENSVIFKIDSTFGSRLDERGVGDLNNDGCIDLCFSYTDCIILYSGLTLLPVQYFKRPNGEGHYYSTSSERFDINNDNYNDIIYTYFSTETEYYGNVALYLGSSELDSVSDYEVSQGPNGIGFGRSCSFLGDINDDGKPEIAVGALGGTGKVYIYSFGDFQDRIDDTNVEKLDEFSILKAYPNPFNPKTTISFDLPEEAKVEIVVYDLMGREIWKSAKTHYSAGTYSIVWNGTNHSGQPVGTGMYLVRLNSNKYSATQKVLLMK